MNFLPIPADSLDFLTFAQIPAAGRLLSSAEMSLCQNLVPGIPSATLAGLSDALPYTVSFYQTPDGWLCTTRRAMAAHPKVKAIIARELDPTRCWQGITPAHAMLNMIAERLESKELSWSRGGGQIDVMGAFVVAA